LHDQLTPMTGVGGVLIVVSVYMISRYSSSPLEKHSAGKGGSRHV
jgi:hypothetical protein